MRIRSVFSFSVLVLLTGVILCSVSGVTGDAQASEKVEKHPFSIHDMLAMDRLSDPQVSPDGKWVVFNVRVTDVKANKGLTDIWVSGVDGKDLRRLTTNPELGGFFSQPDRSDKRRP